jgi:hypothetical protein
MDQEIHDWLMAGQAWLKYAVQSQLLNEHPEKTTMLKDEIITGLVRRVKDPGKGITAARKGRISCEVSGSAVWDMFFLADIGLSAADLDLQPEAETILGGQLANGNIITEPSMEPNYYCMSAILIATLARMGYRDDRRVRNYVRTIIAARHDDSGWVCESYHTDCCPMDNLNILMLLGQYPEFRQDSALSGALELLLEHWRRRGEKRRLQGFGIGRRYLSLEYPAIKYGVLRVLEVLSLFPYAMKQTAFVDMLSFVQAKNRDGKYYAEPTDYAYRDYDFGQTAIPSRWITFLVNRIVKRAAAES